MSVGIGFFLFGPSGINACRERPQGMPGARRSRNPSGTQAPIWLTATEGRPLTGIPGDGAHGGREPVATTKLGGDEVSIFAESFAQSGDLNLQVVLGDSDPRPHTAQEFGLGDQRSVGFDQRKKEI